MNERTRDYINGYVNVTEDTFTVSREKAGTRELVFIGLPELDKPLYALWNSKKTAKQYERTKDENGEVKFEKVKKAKGTGGKETYVMLMPKAIKTMKNSSIEAKGIIIGMTDCIEWNTGRLYNARTKKSMSAKDIAKHLNISVNKVRKGLKELTRLEIIKYDNKSHSYFLHRKMIRKGR